MIYLCERRSLVQRVTGDGQKDVEECVVSAESEHHEVEGVHEAALPWPPLGVDGVIHDLVPVFTSEYL